MRYDDGHEPDFSGAKGKCENCGLVIELTADDRPKKKLDYWTAVCPICGSKVSFYRVSNDT
jgi:hypothetical protein